MRSFKEALDGYMGSEEWQSSADAVSLMAPPRMRVYLENRLMRAFDAGWQSREQLDRQAERLADKAGAARD